MGGHRRRSGFQALAQTMMFLLMVGALVSLAPIAVAHPAAPKADAGHVTILVLDMSGSMSENDPTGLRCSAANAYIDLSGPGAYVGVVGLDSASGGADSQGFDSAVDWGLTPREMASLAARKDLRDAIQQKSNGCRPNGSTPTFDALDRARAMLDAATQGNGRSGSVILLTDGAPYPRESDQINAIRQTLIPQFKDHHWPVDTIALGHDQGFHSLLSDIASATSGSYYDDGHGVIPGVSPLNIMPFFLDIFKLRNGRSPGPDIAPTALHGDSTARNFSVGQFVSHLDVVVVKDTPNTAISILAPNGQRFPPSGAGVFVSTDPYYAIFSIDSPQQGAWELDAQGNGLFLMSSLKTSTLALQISSPPLTGALALGEPFTVAARLTNQGTAISGGQYTIKGVLTYTGGDGQPFTQDVVLADTAGSGQYEAKVTLPATAPAGSYKLSVSAHAASEDVLTAEAVVRFALFPAASFISPTTGHTTTDTVAAQAVSFDPILQTIYRFPPMSWISGLPLDGHEAAPSASVRGQVVLQEKPYSQATVTGTAARVDGKTMAGSGVSVIVRNDGNGAFHVIFPAAASATYAVNLATSGAYGIAHGDLTHSTHNVQVTVAPAVFAQELRAWIITILYALALLLLALLTRAILAPHPAGMLVNSEGGGGEEFARARRNPVARLVRPSVVTSEEMGLDPGLRFRFHHGGRVTVQGAGRGDAFLLQGEPISRTPVSATEAQLTSADGAISYTVSTSRAGADDFEEEGAGRRGALGLGKKRARDDDDFGGSAWNDESDAPRRSWRPKRKARGDDDDWGTSASWGEPEPKKTRGSRKARSTVDDDDW